jgi:hypothetical protein
MRNLPLPPTCPRNFEGRALIGTDETADVLIDAGTLNFAFKIVN